MLTQVQIAAGTFVTMAGLHFYVTFRPITYKFDNVLAERCQWATLIVLMYAMLRRIDTSYQQDSVQDSACGTVLTLVTLTIPITLVLYIVSMHRDAKKGAV